MVVKEDLTPLLGKRTSEQMGIIQVRYDKICKVEEDDIFNEFSDVFDGKIGTLPGKVHLTIDKTVKPTAITRCGRLAISLKNPVKEKLEEMMEDKVLAKVDEPTEWVSRMAIGMKDKGKIRMCLDPQELNKALLREHHPTPTLDDVLHELRGQ